MGLSDWWLAFAAWLAGQPADEQNPGKQHGCKRVLSRWEKLDAAVEKLPLHCQLQVMPGIVVAHSSVTLKEGQSIKVFTTPGTFTAMETSLTVETVNDLSQLLSSESGNVVNMSGQGVAYLVLEDLTAFTFIIDGKQTFIDPHLQLPLPESRASLCSGETGIVFTDPKWAETLVAYPQFSTQPDCLQNSLNNSFDSNSHPAASEATYPPGILEFPGRRGGKSASLKGQGGASSTSTHHQAAPGQMFARGRANSAGSGGNGGGKRPPDSWNKKLEPYHGDAVLDLEAWIMVFWHYLADIMDLPPDERAAAFIARVLSLYNHAWDFQPNMQAKWSRSFANALNAFTGKTFIPVTSDAYSPHSLSRWLNSEGLAISRITSSDLYLHSLQEFLIHLSRNCQILRLKLILDALQGGVVAQGMTAEQLHDAEMTLIMSRRRVNTSAGRPPHPSPPHRSRHAGVNPSRHRSGYRTEASYSDINTSGAESDGGGSTFSTRSLSRNPLHNTPTSSFAPTRRRPAPPGNPLYLSRTGRPSTHGNQPQTPNTARQPLTENRHPAFQIHRPPSGVQHRVSGGASTKRRGLHPSTASAFSPLPLDSVPEVPPPLGHCLLQPNRHLA